MKLRDRLQKLLGKPDSLDGGKKRDGGKGMDRSRSWMGKSGGCLKPELLSVAVEVDAARSPAVANNISKTPSTETPVMSATRQLPGLELASPSSFKAGSDRSGPPPAFTASGGADRDNEEAVVALVSLLQEGSPAQRAAAVEALFNAVADDETARGAAAALDVVPPLVGLLHHGSNASKMYAAYTLSALTSCALPRQRMVELAAVGPLLEILRTCPLTVARKGAIRAIGRLARDPAVAVDVVRAGGLDPIIDMLDSGEASLVRRCLIALYFIGADREELQTAICQSGGLMPAVSLCGASDVDVQAEAADVVKVLARNSVAHTQLLEAGPEALAVLTGAAGAGGRSSRARGSAGKALSRLAACNAELARRIGPPWAGEAACTADEGEQGEAAAMMGQLTAIITGGEPSRRAQAAQAVADVAGEDPTASRELAASGIVGPLVELLGAGTSEGKHYAAAALAKMAADRLVLDTIYSAGAVTPLVACLSHPAAYEGAAATVELLAGHPQGSLALVGAGAVAPLTACLRSGADHSRLAAARALLLLAEADAAVPSQVVKAAGIPALIDAAWQGTPPLQGAALALLQRAAGMSHCHEECFNCGAIALLMWLKRAAATAELQPAADDLLSKLSKSPRIGAAIHTEMRLQGKIGSLMAEVRAKVPVSPQVEQAFCAIPRGIFSMAAGDSAYQDTALVMREIGTEISPASADAAALEGLRLRPGLRVLEVGSGSGFTTALLAFIVGSAGHVTGVEVNEGAAFHSESCIASVMKLRCLAELHADILLRDVFDLRSAARFDRVLASVDLQLEHLDGLLARLQPGGVLVAPCGGRLLRITADGGLASAEVLAEVCLPAVKLREDVLAQQAAGRMAPAPAPPPGLEYLGHPLPSRLASHAEASTAAVRPVAATLGRAGSSGSHRRPESPVMAGGSQPGHSSDLHELLLSMDDIQVCTTKDGKRCRLGEGGFGVVYKAVMNGVDEVAMKLVKADNPTEEEIEQFAKEVRVLRSLHHRNIVQFYGACLEPGSLFFATELMKGGDLYTALRSHPETMRWERLGKKVMLDIALGMNYLHTRRPPMMHRDLKSPNVLLSEEGVAKIADVGMVRTQVEKLVTAQPVMTPLWAAPEVIRHERASIKADIWSYGILVWEVVTQKDITGFQPLAIACQMVGAQALRLPADAPAAAAKLFQECTRVLPEERPTAAQIVEMLRSDGGR